MRTFAITLTLGLGLIGLLGPGPAPVLRFQSQRTAGFWGFAVMYCVLALASDVERLIRTSLPPPLRWALGETASLRSVNSYGLFAVMTTERKEIVLEGKEVFVGASVGVADSPLSRTAPRTRDLGAFSKLRVGLTACARGAFLAKSTPGLGSTSPSRRKRPQITPRTW